MHIESIIRKLDFTTLLLFNNICEEGSLTKAAERNRLALSAASKRLTELEQALGTKLFIRDSTGMNITPAGESLLFYTRTIMECIYKASTELDEYKVGLKGFVRLQASVSVIIQFLSQELGSFIESNPSIKVELEQRSSYDIIINLQNRSADIGICVVDYFYEDLLYYHYRSDRLVLVAKSQDYLIQNNITGMDQALDYDFIGLQSQSTINQNLHDRAVSVNKNLKLRIVVAGFDALCIMAQAGIGIGLIPKNVYEMFGKPLGLGYLEIDEPWAKRDLYLICKPDVMLNAVSLTLKTHLLRHTD